MAKEPSQFAVFPMITHITSGRPTHIKTKCPRFIFANGSLAGETLIMKMVMTLKSVMRSHALGMAVLFSAASLLSACGDANPTYSYPTKVRGERTTSDAAKQGTIFSQEGLDIFGQGRNSGAQGGGAGLGINSFLWRASLDTISFLPIASADPFGGVIITDWYAPPETPDERFKLNVFIMGKTLRADGIKITAFRQTKDENGNWLDTPTDANVVTELENTVLTRARKMRIAAQAVADSE